MESTALKTCIRKEEKYQINNLSAHCKNPEKEEQNKPPASRRKEIMKSRN